MAYHTLAWLAWLCAAAYLALVNGQPLHTLLIILATGTVFTLASERSQAGRSKGATASRAEGWSVFLRFGLWVWGMAAIFNLLFAHQGDVVLFTLPRDWPLIGGPITLEGLLYGLANGASLFAVLLVFATFNLALDAHRLLRWLPGGLFQAGLIVSIALSFVPQMMASLKDIREAQRVRGHRFRGLRDWIPLFVPLVTTALERSLTLAESMETRGFGGVMEAGESISVNGCRTDKRMEHKDSSRQGAGDGLWGEWPTTLASLVGLLAVLVGLLWRATGPAAEWPGLVSLALGVLLLLAALYRQGRRFKRTQYRREVWLRRDTWVSLASVLSMLIVVYVQVRHPLALFYYPYPPSSPWPTFTPLLGLGISLIAAPALVWLVGGTVSSGAGQMQGG